MYTLYSDNDMINIRLYPRSANSIIYTMSSGKYNISEIKRNEVILNGYYYTDYSSDYPLNMFYQTTDNEYVLVKVQEDGNAVSQWSTERTNSVNTNNSPDSDSKNINYTLIIAALVGMLLVIYSNNQKIVDYYDNEL